jgi:diaminopimelate decarboxylase
MSALDLVAEHGSPLWLADLDRVRTNARRFRRTWETAWPDVAFAYSYKTNRTPAILRAVADEGFAPEVVCEAELGLACALRTASAAAVVNGPAKTPALLARAADLDALVLADSVAELSRLAAAGVTRVGLRVAMDGIGTESTRFGIPPDEVPAAVAAAARLGLRVRALGAHRVSIGFGGPLRADAGLSRSVVVQWPRPEGLHVEAATMLAALAHRLRRAGTPIEAIDLGGGYPTGTALARCAGAVAAALDAGGFRGRLILEPGRALVADAVDLIVSVVAVKHLADGQRCIVVDGGTNLVPGALWGWPAVEALQPAGPCEPTLVTGPLCLNIDVIHPAAALPPVVPGDLLAVRAVGAYQQTQSTQFGDLRPAVVARDGGEWRPAVRRETVADLVAGAVSDVKEVR